LPKYQVWTSASKSSNSWCNIKLCQMSCSLKVKISRNRFCSVTLQDGRQLPLTNVLYSLKEASVLNALNADLTQFWQNVCFGCQNFYLEIYFVNQFPSWEMFEERESGKLKWRKSTSKIAITYQCKVNLQSQANESYHDHSIFGAPQSLWSACM
jgi:hypothetical protein